MSEQKELELELKEHSYKINPSILQLLSTEDLEYNITLLKKELIGKVHCPKVFRSYDREFRGIYLFNLESTGDILNNIKSEIDYLTGRDDEGAIERLVYLIRWTNKTFGTDLRYTLER